MTVNTPDSGDHLLKNTVVTPGGDCVAGSSDPACSVTVPVQSFRVVKTANAATAVPGAVVDYTITVINTGEVAFTQDRPASFSDDLTNVLTYASYDGDVDSGATYAEPTIHWSGALPIGGVVSVTYSVRLAADASAGERLLNTVVTPEDPSGVMSNCLPGDPDPSCAANVTVRSATASGGQVAFTGLDVMPALLWAVSSSRRARSSPSQSGSVVVVADAAAVATFSETGDGRGHESDHSAGRQALTGGVRRHPGGARRARHDGAHLRRAGSGGRSARGPVDHAQ
ncbi:hypothetical protein [Pseudolysinimonas kribbensis]|uniref:DUF7927 domain-containing protein n=1 Tax=Pseudolysinimonas kribbensis TaxID=433641 RepID=UPI0024E10E6F|nr:hypothetical protein [Pseudolysinimonas kribbensis]